MRCPGCRGWVQQGWGAPGCRGLGLGGFGVPLGAGGLVWVGWRAMGAGVRYSGVGVGGLGCPGCMGFEVGGLGCLGGGSSGWVWVLWVQGGLGWMVWATVGAGAARGCFGVP